MPERRLRRWAALLLLAVVLGGALAEGIQMRRRLVTAQRLLADLRVDPFGLGYFPPAPVRRPGVPRVVMLGDSRAAAWPLRAPSGVEVINRGIGGQTSAQVLGRYEAHVASLRPDVIVLQVGVNDLVAAEALPERADAIIGRCEANIRALVDRATRDGASVVLTTIFPPGDAPVAALTRESPAMLHRLARLNGALRGMASPEVLVFDAAALLADRDGRLADRYALDWLHLNESGYARLSAPLDAVLDSATRIVRRDEDRRP